MSALEKVKNALRAHGCRGSGGHWTCPAHEDRSPSLSVRSGNDGRALLHCFAGCETLEVVAAIGLSLGDLFDEPLTQGAGGQPLPRRSPPAPKVVRGWMGLPTFDDLFWSQSAAFIDRHFARLEDLGRPTDDEVSSCLAASR